jgi:aerobic carbon-monoxide dehydrogenase medium subunit
MIAQSFEYTRPKTLEEALSLLADGSAKVLAGGMSLIPLMKLRLAAPERVVDVARLPELNYIREENNELHIGATVTHHQIESSPLIRSRCPLLPETAAHVGDMQVRNRGTIGGSVAHADPASDYPAALLALEARVGIAGPSGNRTTSFLDFVVETFTTVLEPGEIVREVILPFEHGSAGYAYQKVVQPASGFAIVGIAVRVRKEGGKIAEARVGVTGLGPRAYRATNVEAALTGMAGTATVVQHAAALIAEGIDANTDIHASADYRKHLARVYGTRAITVALSRAQ